MGNVVDIFKTINSVAQESAARAGSPEVRLVHYLAALRQCDDQCKRVLDDIDLSQAPDADPTSPEIEDVGRQARETVTHMMKFIGGFGSFASAASEINERVEALPPELPRAHFTSDTIASAITKYMTSLPVSNAILYATSRSMNGLEITPIAVLAQIVKLERDAGSGPLTAMDLLALVETRLTEF